MADQWKWNVEEKDNVAVWRWWNGNAGKAVEKGKKGEAKEKGVKVVVEKKQKTDWEDRVMERKKGPFYWKCKEGWGEEEYLNEKGSKRGRIWKTRMRASAVPLQAELYREHRSSTDMCCVCSKRAVENQTHMLMECDAYQHERRVMFETLASILDDEQCSWNDLEELSVVAAVG